jgi:hypothetical protein
MGGGGAAEEEGQHAGEHLEEEVVGVSHLDAGVHLDICVVVEERGRREP